MKKVIAVAITLLLLNLSPIRNAAAQEKTPYLGAKGAVLIDVRTGQILYGKNHNLPLPPASTTKIITSLLALEYGELDKQVEVSSYAASTNEASINLQTGEKLQLRELLYGALLKSGNDACVAMGEYIGGSEALFVELMNWKAISLGAANTKFKNTNGLPNKEHKSTALDLALMARYALTNQAFNEIIRTKYTTISFHGQPGGRYLKNTNKLLWQYPWADGVKTGTTNAAGQCLVASATKNNRRLIAVVLRSPERFDETRKLLEYGFHNFTNCTLINQGEVLANYPFKGGVQIPLIAKDELTVTIPKGKESKLEKRLEFKSGEQSLIKRGDILGYALVFFEGREIGRVPLCISYEPQIPSDPWLNRLKNFFIKKDFDLFS